MNACSTCTMPKTLTSSQHSPGVIVLQISKVFHENSISSYLWMSQRFLALCILWPLTMVGVVVAVNMLTTKSWAINKAFGKMNSIADFHQLFSINKKILIVIAIYIQNMPCQAQGYNLPSNHHNNGSHVFQL